MNCMNMYVKTYTSHFEVMFAKARNIIARFEINILDIDYVKISLLAAVDAELISTCLKI